eukprot:jgi/Galph1/864/GphlegSOOS_G5613.1
MKAIFPVAEQNRLSIIVMNASLQFKEILKCISEQTLSLERLHGFLLEFLSFIGFCSCLDDSCSHYINNKDGGASIIGQMYSEILKKWNEALEEKYIWEQLSNGFLMALEEMIHKMRELAKRFPHGVRFVAIHSLFTSFLSALDEMSNVHHKPIHSFILSQKYRLLQILRALSEGCHGDPSFEWLNTDIVGSFLCGDFSSDGDEADEFLVQLSSFIYASISSICEEEVYKILDLLLKRILTSNLRTADFQISLEDSENSILLISSPGFECILDAIISAVTCMSSELLHRAQEGHCNSKATVLLEKLSTLLKIMFSNQLVPLVVLDSYDPCNSILELLRKDETFELGKLLIRKMFGAVDEQEDNQDNTGSSPSVIWGETTRNILTLFQEMLDALQSLLNDQDISDTRSKVFLMKKQLSFLASLVTEFRGSVQKMWRKTRGLQVLKNIVLAEDKQNSPRGEMEMKKYFPTDFLETTILSCFTDTIPCEIFTALLEIVLEVSVSVHKTSTESTSNEVSWEFVFSNIPNPSISYRKRLGSSCIHILYLIMRLSEFGSIPAHAGLCNFLTDITSNNHLNASLLESVGITEMIIQRLFFFSSDSIYHLYSSLREAYTELLCSLLRCCVSPSSLSQLFSVVYIMSSSDQKLKRKLVQSIIPCFRALTDSFQTIQTWPRCFFDFSGIHSGLVSVGTSVDLLKRKDGICFTFWIRREPLQRDSCLFYLNSLQNLSIEFFLNSSGILCIRSHGELSFFHNTDIEIPSYVWIFLCFRFRKISSGKHTNTEIFLNGRWATNMKFTRPLDRIDAFGIGCVFNWNSEETITKIRNCFHGEFSAAYCFNVPLSDSVISNLYDLGPSFDNDFQDTSRLIEESETLEGLSSSCVLFLYTPRACADSRQCPNCSSNSIAAKSNVLARLVGLSTESRTDFRVIFSLLSLGMDSASNLEEKECYVNKVSELVRYLLKLTGEVIQSDKLNELDWLNLKGFDYLGAWFYESKLFFTEIEFVDCLLELLRVCSRNDQLIASFSIHCIGNEFLWQKMSYQLLQHFWERLYLLTKHFADTSEHVAFELFSNFDVESAVVFARQSEDLEVFKWVVDFVLEGIEVLEFHRWDFSKEETVSPQTSKINAADSEPVLEKSICKTLLGSLLYPLITSLAYEKDQDSLNKLQYLLTQLTNLCQSFSRKGHFVFQSLMIRQDCIAFVLKIFSSVASLSVFENCATFLFHLLQSEMHEALHWFSLDQKLAHISEKWNDKQGALFVTGISLFLLRSCALQQSSVEVHIMAQRLVSGSHLTNPVSLKALGHELHGFALPLIFLLLGKEANLISRASMIQTLAAILEEHAELICQFLSFDLWPFWLISLFPVQMSGTHQEEYQSCYSASKKLLKLIWKQMLEKDGIRSFALQVLLWLLESIKDTAVPLVLSKGVFGMNIGVKNVQELENQYSDGLAAVLLFTELLVFSQNTSWKESQRIEISQVVVEVILLLGLVNIPHQDGSGERSSNDHDHLGCYAFPSSTNFDIQDTTFVEFIGKGGFVRIFLRFVIDIICAKLHQRQDASYYETLILGIVERKGGLKLDEVWQVYIQKHLSDILAEHKTSVSGTDEMEMSFRKALEGFLEQLSSSSSIKTRRSTSRKSFALFRSSRNKSPEWNDSILSLLKNEEYWNETGAACLFSQMMEWKNYLDSLLQVVENTCEMLWSVVNNTFKEESDFTVSLPAREAESLLRWSEWRRLGQHLLSEMKESQFLKEERRKIWTLEMTMDSLQRRWLLRAMPEESFLRGKENNKWQRTERSSIPSETDSVQAPDVTNDSWKLCSPTESDNSSPHLTLPVYQLESNTCTDSKEADVNSWSVESPQPSPASSNITPVLSGTEWLAAKTAATASEVQWSGTCIWVRFLEAFSGRMELRERSIRFLQSPFQEEKVLSPGYFVNVISSEDSEDICEMVFPLSEIEHVEARRFLLQRKALEIFLRNKTCFFFAFQTTRACKTCLRMLSKLLELPFNRLTPIHHTGGPRSAYAGGAFKFPRCLFDSKTVQALAVDACARWKRRQLSNFEYLCILNRLAGRTNNDLSQYPVFPWILADYSSEELDLTDIRTFRDLTKPMGCQTSTSNEENKNEREQRFRERFESWSDKNIPPFHYGSHYSSAASVLHYLVRLEPFTGLFLRLQGGLFDHPDRMFHCVQGGWKSVTTSMQDVKELIPEFFYMPEIFRNNNDVSFGTTQDGQVISHVQLPPWAKDSPEHFVRVHREALESEYVSMNLHHWIDLIFGIRQRGPLAVESCNVFFYLTYEEAVDLESIQDIALRESMETQIAHFGQTPPQLLEDAFHPARERSTVSLQPSYWTPQGLTAALEFSVGGNDAVVQICQASDRILTITRNQSLLRHRWIPLPDLHGSPFTLETETKNISETEGASRMKDIPFRGEVIGGTYLSTNFLQCRFFSLYAATFDGKVIISVGHWDWSIRCSLTADPSKPIQVIKQHRDIVTCLSIGTDGRTLVTGSKDTTVFVWELIWGDPEKTISGSGGDHGSYPSSESKLGALLRSSTSSGGMRRKKMKAIKEQPKYIFYQHEYPVVAVAVSTEVGVVASNDSMNILLIHNLTDGALIRISDLSHQPLNNGCLVTCRNELLLISSASGVGSLYTCNGIFLEQKELCSQDNEAELLPQITSWTATNDGRLLFIADDRWGVAVFSCWDLRQLYRYLPCPSSPISALCLTAEESILLAGIEDGRIVAYTVDRVALLQKSCLFGVRGPSNPFYGT